MIDATLSSFRINIKEFEMVIEINISCTQVPT
jgi:hypothetical protein